MKILHHSINQTGRYHRARPVEVTLHATGHHVSTAASAETCFLSLQAPRGGSHQLGERWTLEFSDADANDPLIIRFLACMVARLAADSHVELRRALRRLAAADSHVELRRALRRLAAADNAADNASQCDELPCLTREAIEDKRDIAYARLLEVVSCVRDAHPNAEIDALPASTLRLVLMAVADEIAARRI